MMIQGKVVRESLNVFDSTTFKYTSYIMFRGHLKQMTGRYTCQKVGDSLRSSSVFMFWGGKLLLYNFLYIKRQSLY